MAGRVLQNAMMRFEKVECLEGTRKLEIRQSISSENVEERNFGTNTRQYVNKDIEVFLLQKEIPQPRYAANNNFLGFRAIGAILD